MIPMSKLLIAGLIYAVLPAWAQSDAEALVASKRSADMSYQELMQILGRSLTGLQDGVLLQNGELVRQAANAILHHPAPSHKPWAIVLEAERDGFKPALLTYDKVLDLETKAILAAAETKDWLNAAESLGRLQQACISCHLQWRTKARF